MSVAADTAARAPSVPEGAKALSKAVGADVPVETTKAMHPAAPGGSALMRKAPASPSAARTSPKRPSALPFAARLSGSATALAFW